MPAFAGVIRRACEDQGQQTGIPLHWWRIPANAARTACGALFELTQRPGRIAPPHRHAFGARSPRRMTSQIGHCSAVSDQGRGAMRAARGVSSKNGPQASRTAEAPFRPKRPHDLVIQTIPYRPSDHPSRSRDRKLSPESRFSARRPRRHVPDLTVPNGPPANHKAPASQ
jgi:hypothetical protein